MARRSTPLVFVILVALVQSVSSAQTVDRSWQALDARVTELYAQGDLRQAIEVAEAALRVASTPAESGRSLDRLGFLSYTSGDLTKGERYLRDSLQTREAAFGSDSLEAAETANDLAMLLRDLRRMDEARTLASRAVAVRERSLGPHALPLAESLNTLGTVAAFSGEYAMAVARFEQALAIHEERPVAERATEEYGTLCVNLAGTYQRLGKYGPAETTFHKGLDALRIRPGMAHPAYGASELAYAALEVDLGQYATAERLYDEGGRLVEQQLGKEHPVYATLLNNRGFFFQSIGNFKAAEADYRGSLELKRRLYGPNSVLAVSTLRNLAHLTYALDRGRGEQLLAEAVEAYAGLANAPAFDYASVLIGLARAQRERGAVADARATAVRAVDLSRQRLGEQHPLFASSERELGLAAAASQDVAEGERLLRHALATAEQVHGPSHPDVAGFLDALADLRVQQRDFAGAHALYARSLAIQDRFLTDVLAIGSESFKAATMASSNDPVPRLMAFQRAAPEFPAARALAFEAAARRKGRLVDQIKGWQQWLDEGAPEAVRRRAADLGAFLGCRTSLIVALGYRDLKPAVAGSCSLDGTELEGRYERLLSDLRTRWTTEVGDQAIQAVRVLQERAEALETSLSREAGAPVSGPGDVSVDRIRARLGEAEALVEFVSYGSDTGARDAPRRYGAFVVAKHGMVGWADLGPAAAIDGSIRDLSSAANDWSISLANHEADAVRAATRTAQDALADLSRRVWTPVAPLIGASAIQLRVSPDGLLNLVPFEALGDGRALIDRFAITYLPAGRDLVAAVPAHASTAAVVVVSPGPHATGRLGSANEGATFRADRLAPLAAAAVEAADVRRLVRGAQLFKGPAATEQRVKALHGPALLHIVGHGVVRNGDDCDGRTCVAATTLSSSTQAMTLAAVVLEEAYGRRAGSREDGLLTAMELQNVDLRGTEMLVLSQCQMASGLASVGEGVYGMRRAAALAGARTFVAPLWNVDDDVQRRLMDRFYRNLAAGETRAQALREAKLTLRRSPATSSFLYWAPVIMSGSAGTVSPSLFHP